MVFKAERLGYRSLGASSARRRRRRRLRSALPWCYRSYPVSVVSSTASSLSGTSSLSSTSSSSGMSSSLVRTWYSIRGGARSTAAGICAVVLPVRLRFWGRSSGSCCLNGAQKRLRLERCLDGPFRSLNSLRVSRTQVLHRGLCLSSVILPCMASIQQRVRGRQMVWNVHRQRSFSSWPYRPNSAFHQGVPLLAEVEVLWLRP